MSRILWYHPRPVLPPDGGGQVRTVGLISAAVDAGHEVMLVQPAGARPGAGPPHVEVIDLSLRRGAARMGAKLFSRYPLRSPQATLGSLRKARTNIARFQPDICVVSEVLAWSIAARTLPNAPYLYDAHNVETDLYRSFRDDAQSLIDLATFGVDHRRMARIERAVTARAAALVSVTIEDAARLSELAPVARSIVVPSSVPTPTEPSAPAAADRVVLFVGTLDYPPNTSALEELLRLIMPALREEVGEVRLVVVGRRPPRRLRVWIESTPWCELREGVPDLAPSYHEARCVVLPIRTGGGSRLKVFEALSYGLPVVATELAVSGVTLQDGVDVLISDVPEQMVEKAARIFRDDEHAAAVGRAARKVFCSRLSWSRVSEPLLALLDSLTPLTSTPHR